VVVKEKDWLMEAVCPGRFMRYILWAVCGLLSYLALLFFLAASWIMGLMELYAAIGCIPILKLPPVVRLSMWGSYFLSQVIWFGE